MTVTYTVKIRENKYGWQRVISRLFSHMGLHQASRVILTPDHRYTGTIQEPIQVLDHPARVESHLSYTPKDVTGHLDRQSKLKKGGTLEVTVE